MPRAAQESSATPARDAAVKGHRGRSFVTLGLVFVALLVVLDGLVGERGLLANRQAEREFRREQETLRAEQARNEELREAIARLNRDPAAMENLARRQLGLIRPGEKLFIVKDRPRGEKKAVPEHPDQAEQPGPSR